MRCKVFRITPRRAKLIVQCLISALLGLACVCAPPFLMAGGIVRHSGGYAMFPLYGEALDNFALLPSWGLFALLGFAQGFVQPRKWGWLALANLAIFPLLLILDASFFPGNHAMFPNELLFYLFAGSPAFLCAFFGALLHKRQWRKRFSP